MVGIAMLGTGIFAQEEHLPAIRACAQLELKAVYSRSQESAQSFSVGCGVGGVGVYFDSPASKGTTLADLLARDDIGAVVVCLPITTQPDVVRRALDAGKHVFSEKPVGKDVATARALIEWYEAGPAGQGLVWGVAENFRFCKSIVCAERKIGELGGDLVTFRLQTFSFVDRDNKYYNTPWRKVPDYQGGFLLDGGVHSTAALRALLAAAGGQSLSHLVGFSALLQPHLPPVDTVHAVATTAASRSGTLSLSFGTEFKSGLEVEIVTTAGSVLWGPRQVQVTTKNAAGDKVEHVTDFPDRDTGVVAEMAAFAASVEAGKTNPRQGPREALGDLEILEALLVSEGRLVKMAFA